MLLSFLPFVIGAFFYDRMRTLVTGLEPMAALHRSLSFFSAVDDLTPERFSFPRRTNLFVRLFD